jgi:hypothetical protein
MSTENLNSYGNGLVKDLRNTLNNVVNELKKQKLIEGQGVTLNHGPNGTTISVKKSAPVNRNGISEEPTEHLTQQKFNVCRLSHVSGNIPIVSSFTMYSDEAKDMYLYMGTYSYNLNGTVGTIPSSYIPLTEILPPLTGRNPPDSSTGTLGIRLNLTRTDVPSSNWGSYRMPYYFSWTASAEVSYTDEMMSCATSSCFIPIACFTATNLRSYKNNPETSDFTMTLENTNQYPVWTTAIDQDLVGALDAYMPSGVR